MNPSKVNKSYEDFRTQMGFSSRFRSEGARAPCGLLPLAIIVHCYSGHASVYNIHSLFL